VQERKKRMLRPPDDKEDSANGVDGQGNFKVSGAFLRLNECLGLLSPAETQLPISP